MIPVTIPPIRRQSIPHHRIRAAHHRIRAGHRRIRQPGTPQAKPIAPHSSIGNHRIRRAVPTQPRPPIPRRNTSRHRPGTLQAKPIAPHSNIGNHRIRRAVPTQPRPLIPHHRISTGHRCIYRPGTPQPRPIARRRNTTSPHRIRQPGTPQARPITCRNTISHPRIPRHRKQPPNPNQRINHLLPLGNQLRLIIQMLPLAPGTLPKIPARRLHPTRNSLQHLHHHRRNIFPVNPHHLRSHPLPGNTPKNKHRHALIPRHSLPQPPPRLQGQLHTVAGPQPPGPLPNSLNKTHIAQHYTANPPMIPTRQLHPQKSPTPPVPRRGALPCARHPPQPRPNP